LTTTSNKQLDFVQHVKSLLKIHGRAAAVVPDNVLFFDRRPGAKAPWTKQVWVYDLRTNCLEDSARLPDPPFLGPGDRRRSTLGPGADRGHREVPFDQVVEADLQRLVENRVR
jgi:hypothetical protein